MRRCSLAKLLRVDKETFPNSNAKGNVMKEEMVEKVKFKLGN